MSRSLDVGYVTAEHGHDNCDWDESDGLLRLVMTKDAEEEEGKIDLFPKRRFQVPPGFLLVVVSQHPIHETPLVFYGENTYLFRDPICLLTLLVQRRTILRAGMRVLGAYLVLQISLVSIEDEPSDAQPAATDVQVPDSCG